MRALGWSTGLHLDIRETRGLLIVHAHDHGELQVTGQGQLRLPALVRHRCGLQGGDHVLLVASPGQRQLIIYPPAAIDALIAGQQRTDPMDGESA